MNRAERRAAARHGVQGPQSVVLSGGPMDGWVVKPDAPALRPDWYLTLPRPISRSVVDALLRRPVRLTPPGRQARYVLDPGGRSARWVEG